MTKQINVTYAPLGGNAIRLLDGATETSVRALVERFYEGDENIDVTYGSALPITMFRVFIKEGVIAVNDIQFLFEDAVVEHMANGKLTHWPIGLCDHEMKLLARLVS